MVETFEAAVSFAHELVDGRGKDTFWTKRARGVAAAVYRIAQEEGEKGEACAARARALLRATEAVLLERLGRSIAVSVSMQAKLLGRISPQQRASILAALSAAADKYLQPGGDGPRIGRGLPVNVEGEGEGMSEAEFEAARGFAERLIPDRDEPDAHHWVASGRRLAAAAYLMAGREDGNQGEAREAHARQLLRLPDEELMARLQSSRCVTVMMEGKRLASASAREVASILAMVGLVT